VLGLRPAPGTFARHLENITLTDVSRFDQVSADPPAAEPPWTCSDSRHGTSATHQRVPGSCR